MSRFLTNIISRHIHAENTVQPRQRTLYEPRQAFSESFPAPGVGEATHDQAFPAASFIDHTVGEEIPGSHSQSAVSSASPGSEAEAALPMPQKNYKAYPGQANREVSAEQPVSRLETLTVTSKPGFFFVGKESERLQRGILWQPEGRSEIPQEEQKGKALPGKENPEARSRQALDGLSADKEAATAERLQGVVKPRLQGKLAGEPKQKASRLRGIDNITQVKPAIDRRGMGKTNNQGVAQPIPPVIKIQIGRIEIKAVTEPAVKAVKTRETARPGLTLEQFLKKKEGK